MVIEAGREEPRHNASVGSGKKDGGIVDTNTRTSHISFRYLFLKCRRCIETLKLL